jgi:hypothetical protein
LTDSFQSVEGMDRQALVRLVVDMLQRLALHNGMWFNEVKHQMGLEKAFEMYSLAAGKSLEIQLRRLAKLFGFNMRDGLPAVLFDMPREKLVDLLDALAANWLANDGVWFQAVEFSSGMVDAKRCNDSCWAQFSPVEAWSIKKILGLSRNPGIDGLKQALNLRLYARLNQQSIIDEGPDGIVFQMNECRVQTARKRKGLPDYPCKSVGNVEYPYFARTIDDRITTECIGCPPDDHPDDWYCAWRFSIQQPSSLQR